MPKSKDEIRHDLKYLNSVYNEQLPIKTNAKEDFYNQKVKELKFKLEKEKRFYKKLYKKRH